MKKRILIAAGLFPPEIGGPATYAAMVAKELPQHDLTVAVVPFGSVRHLPKLWRHISYARLLWRQSAQADAIYALDPMSVGIPALFVSRLRRQPLVVRLGGDYAWEQGVQRFKIRDTLDVYTANPAAYGWRVRLFAWLQRQVVRRASLVIVPSQYLRRIVLTWPGVESKRVQVVYSALYSLPAETPRPELRQQLAYNGFVLITACRLAPWKGVDGLLRVVSRLKSEISDLTLVVAGDGPERARLEALAAELNVAAQVRFVGALSKDALGAAIKAADLFVLNTAYEGLSHQLLEVMDLNVPIVTTAVGGNPELIEDGVSGCLIPFGDETALATAIKRLHADPLFRDRLVLNARARLPDFDCKESVKSLAIKISAAIHET